ncbi:deoxynucleotide monophosphate kinase family protein [Streptomyces koyangensis]
MRPNLALIGRARSGKDTVAAHLTAQPYNYVRLAFADELKAAALKADPLIPLKHVDKSVPLTSVVNYLGWERAKDRYPEVRRFLQRFGQGIRDVDEDFWLNLVLRKVDGAARLNIPVVVSDVRYANEANALAERGFILVRVSATGRYLPGAAHRSETELDDCPVNHTLVNGGTIAELHTQVDDLIA